MARVGRNPNTNLLASPMPSVLMAVITHIPNTTGYHKDRVNVVQLCLESMRANAGADAKVMVWDNGSCGKAQQMLLSFGPDYLVLGENIGKSNARKAILGMFPGDTIIAFSDDDIFYYPGWLRASLDVLNKFELAGVVSCYPVRTQFNWGNDNTVDWAEKMPGVKVERGRFIPEIWEEEFSRSIGRDEKFHKEHSAKVEDIRATWGDERVYLTAHHCQFVGYADRIIVGAEYNDRAMPSEKYFDIAIDDAGLLRLTTIDRYARHIGNVIDKDIRKEATCCGMEVRK
jgi:hypothetical protein